MENQIQNLKLNVTNIKSYLISSNKQLKKLRGDKENLFSKIDKQKELQEKENRIENLGIGAGFSRVVGAAITPVRSIIDRIMDFFGIIALGIITQKLPQIVAKLEQFFNSDFMKAVKSLFSTLATGVGFLIDVSKGFTPTDQQKLNNETKNIRKNIDELDKVSKQLKDKEGEYKKIQSDLNIPFTLMAPGSMYPALVPQPKPEEPQKRSIGGTITNDNGQNTYTPRKSGLLRQSETSMNEGFTGFSKSVDIIEKTIKRDEENVFAFAEMSKHFKERNSLIKDVPTVPPGKSGAGGPNGGGPFPVMAMIPGNGTVRGGAVVTQRNDRDGEQTGIDIALKDSAGGYNSGAIIQNPFKEFTITKTGYQFSNGTGFGYYVTGNAIIQGKTYELLVGHLDKIAVKRGDVLKAGDSIGTQGTSGSVTGPHVSTHVNDLSGGGNAQAVLNSVEDAWTYGKIIQTDGAKKQNNGKFSTVTKKINQLNTSNNRGNQSVFIYAVQPVETFVPFPYPVPIERSSSPAPQKAKLPAVWRQ